MLRYRQKLDAYSFFYDGLQLSKIGIFFPGQDPLEKEPPQIERLIALIKSSEPSDEKLVKFENFKYDPGKKSINLITTIFGEEYALDLFSVEAKVCVLDLGFHIKGDNEDTDIIHVKLPFGNSSGTLTFSISPIFEKKDFCTISWENGILSTINEYVAGKSRLFTNTGRPSPVDAEFSIFSIQEFEGANFVSRHTKNGLDDIVFPEEIFPQENV